MTDDLITYLAEGPYLASNAPAYDEDGGIWDDYVRQATGFVAAIRSAPTALLLELLGERAVPWKGEANPVWITDPQPESSSDPT